MFGFPKPLTAVPGQSIDAWLVENGYPQHMADRWPGGVPCRIYNRPKAALEDDFGAKLVERKGAITGDIDDEFEFPKFGPITKPIDLDND